LFRQSYVTVVPSPVDLAGSDSLLERVQLQLVGFVLIVATAGEKENITNFANWSSDVLLSLKSKFKSIVVYSTANVFVVGLWVTVTVPIVHAALLFW